MSHNLTTRADGFTEFAQVGDAEAWHVLGQHLRRGATIEEWATAAGMDWRIQRANVRFATGHDQGAEAWATMPDQHVLLRSDTKAALGIVSARFNIVQPRTLLETFNEQARAAGFELETAGTLFGGRKFWALATDGEQADIVPGDTVKAYTLLVTATDGTMATTGKKVNTRVVCSNTLTMAMGERAGTSKQSHRSAYNAEAMRVALGLVHDDTFVKFTATARRLADKAISAERAERIAFDLLKPAGAGTDLASIEKVTDSLAFKKILGLFAGEGKGAGIDGVKGTGWGFLNAVSEYADHHARATSDDNRMQSAWFGAGDRLKDRALDLLTA